MTKIYGFGNALIDIEVSISEEELSTLDIKKGSMVHISSEQQKIWLSQFKNKILSKEPGGSIANSLQAASTQGSTCLFSCSLGKDQENNIFIEGFTENSFEVFHQYSANPKAIFSLFCLAVPKASLAVFSPLIVHTEKASNNNQSLFDNFSKFKQLGFKSSLADKFEAIVRSPSGVTKIKHIPVGLAEY